MSGKLTLTVAEAAKELNISKPLAYSLVGKDGFPSIRISERRIIIPVDGFVRWLNEQSNK